MGPVHLTNVKAGIDRPGAGFGMACDDVHDIVSIHFARDQCTRLKRYRARRDTAPRRLTGFGVILAQRREAVQMPGQW
jgi:hypothetical protein